MRPDFAEAALVLVGHGSNEQPEANAPVYQHAEALRRRGLFAEVREAFWKADPKLQEVLRTVAAPEVFVVPLFVSQGYFTDEVIPRALGLAGAGRKGFPRTKRRGGQVLHYCAPVGTHESMARVLLARAAEVGGSGSIPTVAGVAAGLPSSAPRPAHTTLGLVGHGTGRNRDSRRAIEQQAERIRALRRYAAVHALFLEEEPGVAGIYRLATTRDVVVVPFLISDGQHAREDIPVLLGEKPARVRARLRRGQPAWVNPTERHGKRLWYAAPAGTHPRLAEVILARVREAAERGA